MKDFPRGLSQFLHAFFTDWAVIGMHHKLLNDVAVFHNQSIASEFISVFEHIKYRANLSKGNPILNSSKVPWTWKMRWRRRRVDLHSLNPRDFR
jgi:hypothetical protein